MEELESYYVVMIGKRYVRDAGLYVVGRTLEVAKRFGLETEALETAARLRKEGIVEKPVQVRHVRISRVIEE